MDEPIITTSEGKVCGEYSHSTPYLSFRGIPYAEPPLGENRFKAPIPKRPWEGVKDCKKEGNICYSREFWTKQLQGSEDCLVLNVYTPKIPLIEPKIYYPVMVYFHGGAFIEGSSQQNVYGPDLFLSQNVLLVTFNYRLNCLGFLNLKDPSLEVPGNCAIRDGILVLKWVQKNIENFGGDRSNVTLFGHSAGAAIVHLITLTPLAEGLYHKAILQSGSALNVWCIKPGDYAKSLAENLGLKDDNEAIILDFLQKQPVEKLIKAQRRLPLFFPIGPTVEAPHDGALWTEHPMDLIKKGKFTKVPMIIGWASQEGYLAKILLRNPDGSQLFYTDFERFAQIHLSIESTNRNLKKIGHLIKEFYYGNEEPTKENLDIFYTMMGDIWYRKDIYNTIENYVKMSPHPVYAYEFSASTQLNLYKNLLGIQHLSGAGHGDELGYLFTHAEMPKIRVRSAEDLCQQRLVEMWTNFAHFGQPAPIDQGRMVVAWEPVAVNQFHYLDIGLELKMKSEPDVKTRIFWAKIDQLIQQGRISYKM